MENNFTPYDPTRLPQPVLGYLDAHDENRYHDACVFFTPDATVVDDGNTYRGIEEIAAWLERSSSEYEYSSTRIGQCLEDEEGAVVQIRLDGTFPGGTVTLRYQFELSENGISRLAIEV